MKQRRCGEFEPVITVRLGDRADSVTVRDIGDELACRRHIAYAMATPMNSLCRKRRLKRLRSERASVHRGSVSSEETGALMNAALDSGAGTGAELSFFDGQTSEDPSAQFKAALRQGRR